jgi:hypothetical protein
MFMTRVTFTLAAWFVLVSVASASLTPRWEPRQVGRDVPPARTSQPAPQAKEQAGPPATQPEFLMTTSTQILLNGEPCDYAAVPAHAIIVRMEVAADRKTVLKVYFRTGK